MGGHSVRSTTNIDGVITPTEQACVPVMDRGFLYGDSVYEVFRTYSGVPLFMQEHFERLENSARLISMHISQSRQELTAEIRRTVKASGARGEDDIYVRYQITRGEGPVDLYPRPELKTRYVIIVKKLPPWDPRFYAEGMRMAVPSVRRNPINSLDPNIKGGNYLNNILAITEARALGADDCVILSREGYVTEAANSNVWLVIDGALVTPGAGVLRGLTKAAIHRACAGSGVETRERDIEAGELARATEAFVTSATREVMPVRSLRLEDATVLEFPAGGGELTRRVRRIFSQYIAEYVREHSSESLFD